MKIKTKRKASRLIAYTMALTSILPSSGILAAVTAQSDNFNREIPKITTNDINWDSSKGWGASLGGDMFKAADCSGAYVSIDDAYIEGVTGGAGKEEDDGYLHLHAGFYPKSETETTTANSAYVNQIKPVGGGGGTLENQYMLIKMQVKVDDVNTNFGISHKINGGWYGGLPQFKDGTLSLLGQSMTYEEGKWYNIVIQYEKDSVSRKAWVNGKEIIGVDFNSTLTSAASFQINQYSASYNCVSDVYLDNVEICETDTAYNASTADTALTSNTLTIDGNEIKLLSAMTAKELKTALNPPENAQVRVMRGNDATVLADSEYISFTDYVYVEAADGVTLSKYVLVNSNVSGLVEDLYNRSVAKITSATETFDVDRYNKVYKGFSAGSKTFFEPRNLIDNEYIDIVQGKYKNSGDGVVRMHTVAGSGNTEFYGSTGDCSNSLLPTAMTTDGVSVVELDFYLDELFPSIQFYLKCASGWTYKPGFKVTDGVFTDVNGICGKSVKLTADQWYNAAIVLKEGTYDLYLDGNLFAEDILYIGGASDTLVKPTQIFAMQLLFKRSAGTENDLYFDNLRIYDTAAYASVSSEISLAESSTYILEENTIKSVSAATTVSDFMSNIILPQGGYYKLFEADGVTEYAGETIKSGTILAVYTGYATKVYTIDSSDYLNQVKSDFNNADDFTDVTNELEISGTYAWAQYYGGNSNTLTKSALGGALSHAANGAWLIDGERISVGEAPAKSVNDTAVKIEAKASNGETQTDSSGTEYTEKQISLYSTPSYTLNENYDFVYEYDVRSEDLNAKTNFILKFNNYGSQFYGVALSKEGFTFEYGRTVHYIKKDVEAKRWYHVTFVQHKNSGTCDIYIDGKKYVDKMVLSADTPDTHCGTVGTITVNITRGTEDSTVYIDNVQYYQYAKDYTSVADDVTSDIYTIDGNDIRGIDPAVTAADFELSIPEGASMKIFAADEMVEVSGETALTSGMVAIITLADGSIRVYKLWVGAAPYMPSIFSDGMVLQRGQNVEIWGETADKTNSEITVSINGQTKTTTPDDGVWSVTLEPMETASDLTLTIRSADGNTVEFNDVAIGEVWICAGQSNMDFRLDDLEDYADYKAKLGNSDIRVFSYPQCGSFEEEKDIEGGLWAKASEKNASLFSAIGYIVANKLEEYLDVPVAIIMANRGGTGIETWLDEESITTNGYTNSEDNLWSEVLAEEKAKAEANPTEYDYDSGVRRVPAAYYNNMIAPITPYSVKGVLWYQGCTNANENQEQYKEMFKNLTTLWRMKFNNENMPFITFQLAPYADTDFRAMRQTQLVLAQEMDNVYLVSTANEGYTYTDGDATTYEIHPWRKSTVALRAAHTALNEVYGNNAMGDEYSAPVPVSAKTNGSDVIVAFDHIGTGLAVDETTFKSLNGFEVSADGVNYVDANAEIVGGTNTVKVYSKEVSLPVAVRYAYTKAVVEFTDGTYFDCENGDADIDTTKAVLRTTLGGNLTNSTGYPTPMFVLDTVSTELAVDFYKNSVADENVITAFDASAEKIVVNVKASDDFAASNMMAVAAVYNGNVLKSAAVAPISANGDVKLEIANESTNTKVKVFIWEQSKLNPYIYAIVLD
ncbi:MAG: sialate O-acetylesterase [Clostridia bacterium]|nr:sialate O-acetylesterase [Clostridia bacterium]